jgi:hypothetical protein
MALARLQDYKIYRLQSWECLPEPYLCVNLKSVTCLTFLTSPLQLAFFFPALVSRGNERRNIMNAITTLILTFSLLMVLTVAGTSTNAQINVQSSDASDTPPSRLAANHNETMLTVR